jgi:hypothetical protein
MDRKSNGPVLRRILVFFFSFSATLYSHLGRAEPGRIELVISVDWEAMGGFVKPWSEKGAIAPNIISSFEQLRDKLPKTADGLRPPMVQLLNPAYFTQPELDYDTVAKQILGLLDKSDEFGLHIHAFHSLLKSAGVNYMNKQLSFPLSFYDTPAESADWDKKLKEDGTCAHPDSQGRCGYGVPLFSFSLADLRKIISRSKELFRQYGISSFFGNQDPTIFRASGGLYSRGLWLALLFEGIKKDTSARPEFWANPRKWDASNTPVLNAYTSYLHSSNRHLFEGGSYSERSTRPSRIAARDLGRAEGVDTSSLGEIFLTEYTRNGSMVDHHFPAGSRTALDPGTREDELLRQTVQSLFEQYLKIVQEFNSKKKGVHYLEFGVHFEFYPIYHKALPIALEKMFAHAKSHGVPFGYAKLPLPL